MIQTRHSPYTDLCSTELQRAGNTPVNGLGLRRRQDVYSKLSMAVTELPLLFLPGIGPSHQNTLPRNLGSISQVMEQMCTRTAF